MRVLVCGGRDYSDSPALFRALDAIDREHGITCIIHGGASGADDIAHSWWTRRYVDRKRPGWFTLAVCRPDWSAAGKAAGPQRNQMMLERGKPDMVLAAPGGRGTADMVRRAREAGVTVIEVA